jgi:hypothetical protein
MRVHRWGRRLWTRVAKREPVRYIDWEQRTYPCSKWWCYRRSPAWRAFERQGRSWCMWHVPEDVELDDLRKAAE